MAYRLKFIFLLSALACNHLVFNQIIDSYGFKAGYAKSNQSWDYLTFDDLFQTYDKTSFEIFLIGKKQLNDNLSIRIEMGYKQKGFVDDITILESIDEETSKPLTRLNDDVLLNNISTNLELIYLPFNVSLKPYFILGISYDYLFSFKDVVLQQNDGTTGNLFSSVLEKFNKSTLGYNLGFGIEINNLFIEYNYNSPKTLYETSKLIIKDKYSSLSLGLYFPL